MEAVASEAGASKATMYRRWPSKAELVLAAFIEGVCARWTAPQTGSLRGDLLELGARVSQQAREHVGAIRGVLTEASRNPALYGVLQDEFVDQHKVLMMAVLNEASDRGEICTEAVSHEILDVLSGYLLLRFLIPERPPTVETVRALVDDVLMPSLPRSSRSD